MRRYDALCRPDGQLRCFCDVDSVPGYVVISLVVGIRRGKPETALFSRPDQLADTPDS